MALGDYNPPEEVWLAIRGKGFEPVRVTRETERAFLINDQWWPKAHVRFINGHWQAKKWLADKKARQNINYGDDFGEDPRNFDDVSDLDFPRG